ncbi:zinc finger protein 569-like [Condylostylus longicornis]|uniref:zinc finger protein 569-like n=1 Tax=Condylostylus longicornis TaxID=2530218 RepID=UPI00244E3910|nr:zinc finger protein 569-like [Condylostylus longicornis]
MSRISIEVHGATILKYLKNMDMDLLCSDYYNLFDSLEEWGQFGNKYDEKGIKSSSGLIKFGEILYNESSTSLVYICELCHKSLQTISNFCDHIKDVHDFQTNNLVEVCDKETINLSSINDKIRKLSTDSKIPDTEVHAKNEIPNENLNNEENYFVIPVSAIKFEDDSSSLNMQLKESEELNNKRARSPSIMRKINKDSRPIDFISNPWHCECGRVVPITHKYQHMKSHNDVPIYECEISGCFDIFFRQSELNEHYELIHNSKDPKKPFSCQFCQRHFSNKKNYTTHVKRIHLSDPRHHTCPYCHYYFYSKSYLQQHVYKKHQQNFSTDKEITSVQGDSALIEQDNFPSEDFYSDIEEPIKNDKYLCKFCNTHLSSNENLLAHMEKLHNIKEISLCRVCGCDINSVLHENNCLSGTKIISEGCTDEKMSPIIFSVSHEPSLKPETDEIGEIPDDEMDFLKFLNVDFDR